MSGGWVRDGHTARIVLDEDTLVTDLICPYDGEEYGQTAWDYLPACRRNWTESGQPNPEDSPLRFCNFREYAENCGVVDCLDLDITRGHRWLINGEFPVGWRWDGLNDLYVWAPSVLIDAATGAAA